MTVVSQKILCYTIFIGQDLRYTAQGGRMKLYSSLRKIFIAFGVVMMVVVLGLVSGQQVFAASDISSSYGSGKHTIRENSTWRYEILSDGTVRIVGYKKNATTVSIPSKISGRKVTKIGGLYLKVKDGLGFTEKQYSIFYGKKTKTVKIPKYVDSIENKAFQKSTVSKVTFASGSKLTKIGDYAFEGSKLTSISLPKKLTSIGKYSFSGTSIKKITVPDSVTKISEGAFSKCKKLTNVKLSASLKKINNKLFMECVKLTKISIPTKVTSIGDYSFSATAFEWIYIPPKVKTIGESAFAYNLKLKGIEIPANVKTIGAKAYEGCTSLKAAEIAGTSTEIGKSAFSDTALSYFSVGSKVKKINEYTFAYDTKLKSVDLGESLTTIKYKAFYNCTNLKTISFPAKLRVVDGTAFDGTAWYKKKSNGLVYAGTVAYDYKGKNPTKISIKSGTLGIATMAFTDCTGIKKIVLPDGLKTIGAGAFLSNKASVKKVTVPASVTSIGKMALGYKLCTYDEEKIKSGTIFKMSSPYSKIAGKKIEGFTIVGKSGSAAEKYAKENGFIFERVK